LLHDAEKLELKVDMDGGSSNKRSVVKDMKSLSGGERSYTSVCFIMALANVISAPFHCMDEFDVFMDAINRRVKCHAAHACSCLCQACVCVLCVQVSFSPSPFSFHCALLNRHKVLSCTVGSLITALFSYKTSCLSSTSAGLTVPAPCPKEDEHFSAADACDSAPVA